MSNNQSTRRIFLKSVGASAVAVAAFGVNSTQIHAAGPRPAAQVPNTRRFDLVHDESVRIHIGSGRRFELTVKDLDGNVLERHRNLNVGRLFRLHSSRFTVVPVPEDVAA